MKKGRLQRPFGEIVSADGANGPSVGVAPDFFLRNGVNIGAGDDATTTTFRIQRTLFAPFDKVFPSSCFYEHAIGRHKVCKFLWGIEGFDVDSKMMVTQGAPL